MTEEKAANIIFQLMYEATSNGNLILNKWAQEQNKDTIDALILAIKTLGEKHVNKSNLQGN